MKDPAGNWVAAYYGIISIGTNTTIVPNAPKTWADLKKPEYKGQVALNGDPRTSGSAFAAVMAASLANGGSADDIMPGIQFFADLKASGNLIPTSVDQSTVISGETPIALDWSYNYPGLVKADRTTPASPSRVNFPSDGVYGGYYRQGVVKGSPHQACAKLWVEHILCDEGALGYLAGRRHAGPLSPRSTLPGKITEDDKANLPPADLLAQVEFLTQAQIDAAKTADARGQLGPDGRRRLIGTGGLDRRRLDGRRGLAPPARPPAPQDPSARELGRGSGCSRSSRFLFLFLLLPTYGVIQKALHRQRRRLLDLDALRRDHTTSAQAFWGSFKISFVTALLGVVFGTSLAYAAATAHAPEVAAIAGRGLQRRRRQHGRRHAGVLVLHAARPAGPRHQDRSTTARLRPVPSRAGSTLSDFWGWVIVYMYFQIPLMVLVTLPAIDGLKPAWREASSNLGGTSVDVLAARRPAGAGAVDARRVPVAVRQRVQRLRHGVRAQHTVEPRAGEDQLLPAGRRRRAQRRCRTRWRRG